MKFLVFIFLTVIVAFSVVKGFRMIRKEMWASSDELENRKKYEEEKLRKKELENAQRKLDEDREAFEREKAKIQNKL